MGVPIPKRIWTAIGLALAGIAMFTQDATTITDAANNSGITTTTLLGDALCALPTMANNELTRGSNALGA